MEIKLRELAQWFACPTKKRDNPLQVTEETDSVQSVGSVLQQRLRGAITSNPVQRSNRRFIQFDDVTRDLREMDYHADVMEDVFANAWLGLPVQEVGVGIHHTLKVHDTRIEISGFIPAVSLTSSGRNEIVQIIVSRTYPGSAWLEIAGLAWLADLDYAHDETSAGLENCRLIWVQRGNGWEVFNESRAGKDLVKVGRLAVMMIAEWIHDFESEIPRIPSRRNCADCRLPCPVRAL